MDLESRLKLLSERLQSWSATAETAVGAAAAAGSSGGSSSSISGGKPRNAAAAAATAASAAVADRGVGRQLHLGPTSPGPNSPGYTALKRMALGGVVLRRLERF